MTARLPSLNGLRAFEAAARLWQSALAEGRQPHDVELVQTVAVTVNARRLK